MPLAWESFFAIFDLMELSFVYDDARPSSYELLDANGAERTGFGVGPS